MTKNRLTTLVFAIPLALAAVLNAYQMYDSSQVTTELTATVEKVFNVCKDNTCYNNVKTDKGIFTLAYGVGSPISEEEYHILSATIKEGQTYSLVTEGKEYHPFYLSIVPKIYPNIVKIK